jgi:tRNA(Ile)-lysidine synthase
LLTATINQTDNTLNISRLQSYSWLQQQLIIRQWFQYLDLKMPSQDIVERILAEIVAAREDADPVLSVQGYSIRRYREKLFCLKPTRITVEDNLVWPSGSSLLKVGSDECYEIVTSSSGIPWKKWRNSSVTVRFRSGGEVFRVPGRKGHRFLKNLYQEEGIPPWERAVIPLIYLDDKLAAVGEHWISAEFYSDTKEPCFRVIRRKINPKGNDDAGDVD